MKYLLMVIDVFSKFAWVKMMKNKNGVTVTNALENIIKLERIPKMLWTDKRKEFYNQNVDNVLKKCNVKWIGSTDNFHFWVKISQLETPITVHLLELLAE